MMTNQNYKHRLVLVLSIFAIGAAITVWVLTNNTNTTIRTSGHALCQAVDLTIDENNHRIQALSVDKQNLILFLKGAIAARIAESKRLPATRKSNLIAIQSYRLTLRRERKLVRFKRIQNLDCDKLFPE